VTVTHNISLHCSVFLLLLLPLLGLAEHPPLVYLSCLLSITFMTPPPIPLLALGLAMLLPPVLGSLAGTFADGGNTKISAMMVRNATGPPSLLY
jgi:hypothetical protein